MSDLGNKKIMAENINRLMNLSNKSRNDLCKDLNIAYTTVSDWINGNTYPRIDKIELLANYFGVDKADLVEKQHLYNNSDEKTLELINLHLKGILHWSTEIGINTSQTTALYEHLDALLLKYKSLIERFSDSCVRWKQDEEIFTSFLRQRNKDISKKEIRKAYLEQELSNLLHELTNWIDAFPIYIANNEKAQTSSLLATHKDNSLADEKNADIQ